MPSSFPIQGPPFNLRLSRWDLRFMPIYSKRLMCFSLRNNSKEHHESINYLLLESLQATVEELPFLAGSVVPFSKEQPWLRDLRSQGVAYLEVQDLSQELSFTNLRKAFFSSSLLDAEQLCPFPAPVYIQDDPVDVCRLRASFIDGGLILAVQIIHTPKRVGTQSPDKEGLPKCIYSFDRTLVMSGKGACGDIEKHPCWTASPFTPHSSFSGIRTVCINFHISSDSLRALKEAVSPSVSSKAVSPNLAFNVSTHDATATLIWRSLILARQRAGLISSDTIVYFATAIDCRSHLDLPKPYFGNAIYGIKISLPFCDLVPSTESTSTSSIPGLQTASRMLRAEINSTTAKTFRDLLSFVERTDMDMLTRLAVVEDLAVGTVMLVSYFGFEMYDLDFGEALDGRIEVFRLPSSGLAPGMPVVLPRLPDGSCEFVMNEREDVMTFLAEDDIFKRFVRKQY